MNLLKKTTTCVVAKPLVVFNSASKRTLFPYDRNLIFSIFSLLNNEVGAKCRQVHESGKGRIFLLFIQYKNAKGESF